MAHRIAWLGHDIFPARVLYRFQRQSKRTSVQIESLRSELDRLDKEVKELELSILDEKLKRQSKLASIRSEAINTQPEFFRRKTPELFLYRGLILFNAKRYEDAAASFELAMNYLPQDVLIIEKLIECYKELGNDRNVARYKNKLTTLVDNFNNH